MSFPRYPKYKDSGVEWLGEVPEHWGLKPIKTLATCNDEVLAESTPSDLEIEYIEISGVTEGRIVETSLMQFGEAPSRARRQVRHGDVLVSTVRTYLRAIAPVVAPPENLIASTGFAVIRPRAMNSGYMRYVFLAEYLIAEVIARSVGVSYPAVNASDLMRLHAPMPPEEEQRVIATFLDRETAKIDALVAKQEKLIAVLQEKRQAVISHAVTKGLDPNVPMKDSGVEWLGEVPEHWEVTRIKRLACSIEQGWSPQCESYAVENPDEWGVLKVGCVNGGTFDPMENKALPLDLIAPSNLGVRAGDLLISRANTRELVGSAAVVLQDYSNLLLCDKLYRIRIDGTRCAPGFIALLLGAPTARGQIELGASGASNSMLNIGQSTIMDMVVALPPLPEQQAIEASILSGIKEIQHLSDAAANTIDLLKERRAALISAAVTGQIDVRELAAAA